jgi:hypothetical protein
MTTTHPDLVYTGTCPTCHQPVWRQRTCTCDHPATAHAYGTRKGITLRTYCNSYGCDCRLFEEVT